MSANRWCWASSSTRGSSVLLLSRAREGWGEISSASTRYTPPFSPVRKHETPATAISRLLSVSAAASVQNWVVPDGVPIERPDASRVYFLPPIPTTCSRREH